MSPRPDTTTWWRHNRGWLAAAALLCPLAFLLSWGVVQRDLDTKHPRNQITANAKWNAYEGARWRLVGVRRETAAAGPAADYAHPEAALILVDYEVIPGATVDVARLDLCKGRLVDGDHREWEANAPARVSGWMADRGLGGTCGSRVVGGNAQAVAGQAFAFTHVYLVPANVRPADLHADIVFPPFTTTPKRGTYLRFALPDPAS